MTIANNIFFLKNRLFTAIPTNPTNAAILLRAIPGGNNDKLII